METRYLPVRVKNGTSITAWTHERYFIGRVDEIPLTLSKKMQVVLHVGDTYDYAHAPAELFTIATLTGVHQIFPCTDDLSIAKVSYDEETEDITINKIISYDDFMNSIHKNR